MGKRLHGDVVLRCSRCHASNPPIHITAKVGNVIIELNLCEKCAATEMAASHKGMIRCPKCGVSVGDIQAMGRMGCADDYELFASSITKGIEKYHGASQHVGKSPSQKLYSA
jgi:protein arginine kinase activator